MFVFGSGLRLGVGFVNPCQSWLASWVGVFGHGLWCCLSFAGCLWCSWLGLGFGLLVVSVAGCACPGPRGLSPYPLSFGLGCSLFFFVVFVCMSRCPFARWAAVPGLVLPVLAGWSPCASLGVLSSVPSGWGVWPPFVLLAGSLVAVGCFHAPPPVFCLWGGGCLFLPLPSLGWRTHCGRCVVRLVPRHSAQRFLCATPRHLWLGFRCRWWWAFLATPD